MIDLRNIETFVWVAELGGFRAAAEKLNTTQPAVSQRIASLESDLGVRLFDRDARGIRLTAKGAELLSHAERMLQMRHDMLQAARQENVMSGTVRIGVAETIVQTWLSTLLERLHAAYPALILEIEVDTTHVLRPQLLARQIDVAFLMGPLQDPKVENIPLCRYPLAWVASPALKLGGRRLSLAEVGQYPIITYPSNSQPYQSVRETLLRGGVSAPRMYGSASLGMAVRMTRDGIGVSVIAPVFLGAELRQGELQLLDVAGGCDLAALNFTATWLQGPDAHVGRTIARLARDVAEQAHGPCDK